MWVDKHHVSHRSMHAALAGVRFIFLYAESRAFFQHESLVQYDGPRGLNTQLRPEAVWL